MTIDGNQYRQVNVHERTAYSVSKYAARTPGSLVDRDANGGLVGGDVRIIHEHTSPRFFMPVELFSSSG